MCIEYRDGLFLGSGGSSFNRSQRTESNNGDTITQHDTVFIQNLPKDVSTSELEEKFGSIGIIKNDKKTNKPKIWIYKDKASGESKGEATVTYDDDQAASAAIDWFNSNLLYISSS